MVIDKLGIKKNGYTIISNSGKPILMSHYGRPKGKHVLSLIDHGFSLRENHP